MRRRGTGSRPRSSPAADETPVAAADATDATDAAAAGFQRSQFLPEFRQFFGQRTTSTTRLVRLSGGGKEEEKEDGEEEVEEDEEEEGD